MSDHPAHPSRRAMLKTFGQLGLFGALAAGVPALLPHHPDDGRQTSSTDDLSLDQEWEKLRAARPDIVIIGDSMLPCRVDPKLLGELLGKRVYTLYRHGSATAHWFLFFKNVVCGVEPRPERVVFFFRDTYWHLPRLRIGGDRAGLIEDLSVGREVELETVLEGSQAARRPLVDAAEHWLDIIYKIDSYGNEARQRITKWAREAASVKSTGRQVNARLDRIFSLENLRHDLADDLADEDTDNVNEFAMFDPASTASFLPHIDSLAREHGIDIGFHRVRRRRFTEPGYREPAALRDYQDDFREWAVSRGHTFSDESGDTSLTADLFADGDHVKIEAREFWTRRLADSLRVD